MKNCEVCRVCRRLHVRSSTDEFLPPTSKLVLFHQRLVDNESIRHTNLFLTFVHSVKMRSKRRWMRTKGVDVEKKPLFKFEKQRKMLV
eukprot:scaffold15521_cov119-Cylindrotheca_fusiformis.AAC.1